MPNSAFQNLFTVASRCFDNVQGQAFELLPRQRADDRNAPDVADTSRTSVEFVAVFVDPQIKPDMPESYDLRTDRRPGMSAGTPKIDIMPETIEALGLVVKVPDVLRCVGTNKRWRVSSVFIDDASILHCSVNLID